RIPNTVDDMPEFIHPSPEPLKATIQKEEQLKDEIRLLINLSATNNKPKMASAESKEMDNKGLEAGLSAIALELARGEREIGFHLGAYESPKSPQQPQIKYPQRWDLQSDEDKLKEI